MGKNYKRYVSLFKLWGKRKKPVWYFTVYDHITKKQSSPRSTFCEKKADAIEYLEEFERKGLLTGTGIKKSPTIGEFLKDFWNYEKSAYIQRMRATRGQDGISPGYCDTMKFLTDKHLVPHFENRKFPQVTLKEIDTFLLQLKNSDKQKGNKILSNGTVNTIRGILRLVFEEAIRQEFITVNVVDKAIRFKAEKVREKDFFDEDERKRFFNAIREDKDFYLLNLLGMCTGCRVSELLSLRVMNIQEITEEGILQIKHSYHKKHGLKTTKAKYSRQIYITDVLVSMLKEYAGRFTNSESYIFSANGKEPYNYNNFVRYPFLRILKILNIKKNVSFHSWRVRAVTLSRNSNLDEQFLEEQIGHKDAKTTDIYDRDKGKRGNNILQFKKLQNDDLSSILNSGEAAK